MAIDINSNVWKKIVQGTVEPPVKSLPLKIQINLLRMQLKTNKISADVAAKELATYCQSNEKMLETDLASLKKLNIFQL